MAETCKEQLETWLIRSFDKQRYVVIIWPYVSVFYTYLKFLISVKNLSLHCLSRSLITSYFTFKFMSCLKMYTEDNKPSMRGFIIGI